MEIDSGNVNPVVNGDDQMLTADIGNMNEITNLLPGGDGQQAWFSSAPDSWSVPYTTAGFESTFPSVLNPTGLEQWTVDPVSSAQVHDAFAALTNGDASFMLPTTTEPQIERLESAVRHDVEPHHRPASSTAAQSPASSSRSSTADHIADLQNNLDRESDATKKLVQMFFSDIHPHWPILHAPTFKIEDASHNLLGAMLMLASWLQDTTDHVKLAPLVFDAVTATLLTTEGMLARAVHLNGILILQCRHQGVFNGQYVDREHEDPEDSPFAFWLAQEQLHRLAFSALRADAYLSLLVDQPPSVRYQEICIPLPKSTHLWTAATEDERRKLQWSEPAGREKARFCFLVRDALDMNSTQTPCQLTEIDYHLGLCSFQAGIWEVAREAHSCDSDELFANSRPRDHVEGWRSHLDLWRDNMEKDCQLRQNYFSASTASADHKCAPLSIILWHYSAIILHAPLKLLQGQGCCFKCRAGTAGAARKNKARYRGWIESSCARIAVWNAAQVAKVVEREFTSPTSANRLRLNPLAIAGLLKSAIVICSYAYNTVSCPACTGGPPVDLVRLFSAADNDENLARWKVTGEGLADWEPLSLPVCRCRFKNLVEWFSRPLAMDKGAEAEFRRFLEGLSKA
ncbi:uncharacterized protein KY384_000292 [Bacidia gigantensis]|uniref:uncharacterized protein n=1 Tax=Bacidia gigantensis TaxID=2732470 RepID=UPI001D043B9A|nr:uncharacterized protein KY384_000292 [Bacidia gigantensis]KAG8526299.1 hypothetical protein KY384_000292 [Bacidia gigantensis]